MLRQYGPVYAVGVLLSVLGWVTKRPDESLWSAVAVGIVLTGPISCLLWRLLFPRPRQAAPGSTPTRNHSQRERRIGFWPFVLWSTVAFAAAGTLFTWIWAPSLTEEQRNIAALATIGVAAFNASSWALLRLLSPGTVYRLGFRK